ncbi:MAG: Uma2 family endonuclease [Symploca sp. SIO2E6]|nr:Uma2 family endonuclease [Symploca sp. SIO2E6]
MTVTIPLKALQFNPGSSVTINNLTWQEFETILDELAEQRRVRLIYYQGNLEIMSPLAIHERPNRIITDIVKAILDSQGRDWEDFGSTTFKRPEIAGVEPDTCLYIQNASQMQGCTHIDLDIDPPPDLAIESDVTSKTTLEVYAAIGVPEVWIYRKQQLKIYAFVDGTYQEQSISPTFPNFPLTTLIPQLVEQAINQGTSRMLRTLRNRLVEGT